MDGGNGGARYRVQRRGGKGIRDIKATARNGKVIGIVSVTDQDEILMMTTRGKIQRMAASEVSVIGRNTQGVRIMRLDDGDTLAAVVRVPKEDDDGSDESAPALAPANSLESPTNWQPDLEATPAPEMMDADERAIDDGGEDQDQDPES